MTASTATQPTVTLTQFATAFTAFSLFLAGSMLGALGSGNIDFLRTHATAWSMTLLASAAMYMFVRWYRRAPLNNWWRLFWTFGWITNVVHFYFGLFHLHDADPLTVFERQGFLLAFSIFLGSRSVTRQVSQAPGHTSNQRSGR